jgi:uncharacterized protein (DUF1330 family)
MVAEIEILDRETFSLYVEGARPVVASHDGVYLTRDGRVTPLSGGWEPGCVVIVRFPTPEHLRACFGSPEYRQVAPLRKKSAITRAVIVEGVAGD